MMRRLGKALHVGKLLALGGVAAYTAIPSCATTATVSDMYTALDEEGLRRRTQFYTDSKKIVCIAELGVGRDDVSLLIRLRQTAILNPETGKFEDSSIVLVTKEDAPKKSDKLVKEAMALTKVGPNGQEDDKLPYPVGRYLCEAVLDGKLERTAAFAVDYAPCPELQIINHSPCAPFFGVDPDRQCNAAGDSGDPRSGQCVCEEKGWNCTEPNQ